MANDKTIVTEVGTALGMTGAGTVDEALENRPPSLAIDDKTWQTLLHLRRDGTHAQRFVSAFANGVAFLRASDGLRGRPPTKIEWTGGTKAPGDDVVPADLRVDHVYFVSCKYLSDIVVNASPEHLFVRQLAGGYGHRAGNDWFRTVAEDEHHALYTAAQIHLSDDAPLDPTLADLQQRKAIANALKGRSWPSGCETQYDELVAKVSRESADRWRASVGPRGERMLWRLLRIGSAPYYVLGISKKGVRLRLRIATPWDWRQAYSLRTFEVEPRAGGQPMVAWRAVVRAHSTKKDHVVEGHVQVRWSHGRFSGPPEAKVYLDTPHTNIPGYFPLV